MKFGMSVRTWDSLPQAKFCKNCVMAYTPFGQIHTKNTNFDNFGAVGPYYLSHNGKFGMRMRTCDTLPKPNLVIIA